MVGYYYAKAKYYFKDMYAEPFEMSLGQQHIFRLIYEKNILRVVIKAITQYGKKISDDTPVLTTIGWKNHGELLVGDKVFSPEGKPIQVKNVMNDGIDIDYEVEFSNGEKIKCHGQHEWLVSPLNSRRSKNPWRVLETQAILKYYKRGNQNSYLLPVIRPLEFSVKNLPIDPYTFGVWLGDGTTGQPIITNHPQDEVILKKIPYKISSKSIHKTTGVVTVRYYKNSIGQYFKKLGKKYIPDEYKFSSVNQRLELLAGLIDTDGSVNKQKREKNWRNGRVYIINSNKQLIDDTCELVRGLGMRVSITKVDACLSSSNIQGRKDIYYVGFQPCLNIPTVIPRKKIFPIIKKKHITIKGYKRINPVRGKCIQVEGGMYLVGKTLIPTHNSEVASMALLCIAIERREKILIIAPSEKQAGIIMGKIIDHLFDHPFITAMIEYEQGSLERLKEEKSKRRITFVNGSEIMILTADSRSVQREAKSLMGFGATIVLVDESSLIPDTMFNKILRMVGGVHKEGHEYSGKLIQLGNPFESNHFGRAFDSKRYQSLTIDWRVALKEDRVTQEFLDEAREDMSELDWLIFYECKFPEGGAEDALIPRSWIELAVNQEGCEGNGKGSGLDVARFGRDKTVYIFRKGGKVERVEITEKMDTMEVTGWVIPFLERDRPDMHCTDVVGIGSGVHDRLDEIQGNLEVEDEAKDWSDCELYPINVGEGAIDLKSKKEFYNLRAQIHWYLRGLFKPDERTGHSQISIPNDPELKKQLGELRYKWSSERKRKMESKDEMKKRLGYSPDKADALALAFWNPEQAETEPQLFISSYS